MSLPIADCGLRIADRIAERIAERIGRFSNWKSAFRTAFRSAFRIPQSAVLLAALLTLVPVLQPSVDAQLPAAADDRYAGLQWRFVRIRYHFTTEGTHVAQDFYGEPWYIDAPAAEQNLTRRVKTATAINVEEPIVMTLDDPRLFQHPWIYFVEPGNLKMLDSDLGESPSKPQSESNRS